MSAQRGIASSTMLGLNAGKHVPLVLQVGLFYVLVWLFKVEQEAGFLRILPVILAGFAIHSILPFRYRAPFFLGLSCVVILVTVGTQLGVALLTVGTLLIGISHLPLRLFLRIGLLLLSAGALALVTIGWLEVPQGFRNVLLPIIGAMFMFRLIVYLYDTEHDKTAVPIWRRLSYFFLLPNPTFLLFPVIDFKTYIRTYYNEPSLKIYEKGIQWCFRGVIQLLLYRLIYYNLTPDASEIKDFWAVLHFMVSSYLLYLRVSGQFHLIVGILCLFGHNLPETHHRYFLASGFNDFWRRINIYWKDFMMKIFYYPVFKAASRRLGINGALVLATAFVFLSTWLLHSYQTFWIRGTFAITAADGIFWGLLGVLVIVNSLYEATRRRTKSLGKQAWSLRQAVLLSGKTVAMFCFMCVLWSFWSTGSVSQWLTIVSAAQNYTSADAAGLILILIGAVTIGVLGQFVTARDWPSLVPYALRQAIVSPVAPVAVILVLGSTQLIGLEGVQFVESMRQEKLNRQDQTLFDRGYYEEIIVGNNAASQRWRIQSSPPDWKSISEHPDLARKMQNSLGVELLPSAEGMFKRALFQTNSWGMRDRSYELKKPPANLHRIALLGSSHVMGSGVRNEEVFEAILESRLNSEQLGQGVEILNFAVGGYTALEMAMIMNPRVVSFEPDTIFYIAHSGEDSRTADKIRSALSSDVPLGDQALIDIIRRSGVDNRMSNARMQRQLEPFAGELLRWGYHRIVEESRKHDIKPVWIFLPLPDGQDDQGEYDRLFGLAEEAGFQTLSLVGIYDGEDRELLRLAPWDGHMNTKAHRLVADRLYELLGENGDILKLGSNATSPIVNERSEVQ